MSSSEHVEGELSRPMSQLSLESPSEDWDRSMSMEPEDRDVPQAKTPRNSVIFPAPEERPDDTPNGKTAHKGKRSLSELLRLHAGQGGGALSAEEARRVADVLGQWINAGSSPYEGEDDFFARSQDDMSVKLARKSPESAGRPRGRSESASSRSKS